MSTADSSMTITLPPSAWMTHGIPQPRNTWAKVAKKGGTSKTSSTVAEADAFARMGLNVLVVDFDPQGNASLALNSKVELVPAGTSRLGNKPILEPDRNTIIEVIDAATDGVVDDGFSIVDWGYDASAPFTSGGPLRPGRIGTVGIIPAYSALEEVAESWSIGDLDLYRRALWERAEGAEFAPHVRWDIVIADLPPGSGKLGRMAVKGAHNALVISTAEAFGIQAIGDSVRFLNDVKENWGHPGLDIAGFVLTTYNPRLKETKAQVEDLAIARDAGIADFQINKWASSIPDRTVFPKSQAYRVPVSRFLSQRTEREGATAVCQVAEAVALGMLSHMGHPEADLLRQLWEAAWPQPLSPFVTGDWDK